jgi:hypothetical protein
MANGHSLGFDPASSLTLRRFAIALSAIVVWAVFAAPQDPMPMLATMMLVAALTDAALALLRGHIFNGPSLNYWDGASGFFAAHCLARAFS